MSILESDFEYVRRLVRERTAIALEADKAYLVEARLLAVAREEGLPGLGDLVRRLRGQAFGRLHHRVLNAMTTNETSFFRDLNPFEMLRQHVIPDLMARRAAQRRLDIWCAACSTGQEVYSLAMLLREHFPALAGWTVNILASDICSDVLERASAGRFSQLEVNRGLPAPLLVKYFRRDGLEWEISADLRRMVTFRELNLATPWPCLPPMDVVLMRNVLIYFTVDTKRDVLHRLRRLLRADGYLFLGGAETTYNIDASFERVQHGTAGCYRLATARVA